MSVSEKGQVVGGTGLCGYLESYLKQQGLLKLIPDTRRPSVFKIPPTRILIIWFLLITLTSLYLGLVRAGSRGLIVGLVLPMVVFILVTFLMNGYIAIHQSLTHGQGSKARATQQAGIVGLLMFCILLALGIDSFVFPGSFSPIVALMVASFFVLILVSSQGYRVHLALEGVRTVFRLLPRSLLLVATLTPILLIVVILSVFSSEVWQAVGSLPWPRVADAAVLLILPTLIFVALSLSKITKPLLDRVFNGINTLSTDGKVVPFLRDKFNRHLISSEEWQRALNDLAWKDVSKLKAAVRPIVEGKIGRWLVLLLVLTSLTLLALFFFYFFAFSYIVVQPSLVATWAQLQAESGKPIIITLPVLASELILLDADVAIAKVSFLLATFATVTFAVQILSDENHRREMTTWLEEKAKAWSSIGVLHQSCIRPGYQVWEYLVRDKVHGILNSTIVVPEGQTDEMVRAACENMKASLDNHWKHILITAFEQNPRNPDYRRGMPGKRWQMSHNRTTDETTFEPIHLELSEIRYEHFLGFDANETGIDIPDQWFGNDTPCIALSRSIWESDRQRSLLLHPYITQDGMNVWVDLHILKRLEKTADYKQLVKNVLAEVKKTTTEASNIWIDLYFRDTVDALVHFVWSKQLNYIDYWDEITRCNRIDSLEIWLDREKP
ncbi:MAG: hypothetical protein WAV74_17850 [Anaerolineae bacterium]